MAAVYTQAPLDFVNPQTSNTTPLASGMSGAQWMDAELETAAPADDWRTQERFASAADKLSAALRDMQIAFAEALGANAALDAHLRLALKHAQAAFDLACAEADSRREAR